MDKSKVACRRFVVAGCQPSGIFKFVGATLNLISQGVDIAIDRNLYFPVFARRDHGIATPAFHRLCNGRTHDQAIGHRRIENGLVPPQTGCWSHLSFRPWQSIRQ